MKKTIKSVVLQFLFLAIASVKAQEKSVLGKPKIAVVEIDVEEYNLKKSELMQYIQMELIRIGKFEVLDKYELNFIAQRDSLQVSGCMSKICLQKVGKKLNVDKIFSAYISQIGTAKIVCLKILNVQDGNFEKMITKEFLRIPGAEFKMLTVTLNEMFELPNDPDLVKKLTDSEAIENGIANPHQMRLRADGPRMGVTYVGGDLGEVITRPVSQGGYGGVPYMFQFGYQFEKQYLNSGNFQALVEFLPMITGLDQGRVIPSFTLLNGIRSNKSGWEFAFGPSVSVHKSIKGYYDSTGMWKLVKDLPAGTDLSGFAVEKRMDNRGEYDINAAFVFAAGKTFKSGKINLPINVFFIPSLHGMRFGVSVGWNGKGRYE